jgi:hypothetical protein
VSLMIQPCIHKQAVVDSVQADHQRLSTCSLHQLPRPPRGKQARLAGHRLPRGGHHRDMGGHGHSDKTLPREDLTDEELRDLCITAVRQHRDEMRLWVSMRIPSRRDVPSRW